MEFYGCRGLDPPLSMGVHLPSLLVYRHESTWSSPSDRLSFMCSTPIHHKLRDMHVARHVDTTLTTWLVNTKPNSIISLIITHQTWTLNSTYQRMLESINYITFEKRLGRPCSLWKERERGANHHSTLFCLSLVPSFCRPKARGRIWRTQHHASLFPQNHILMAIAKRERLCARS